MKRIAKYLLSGLIAAGVVMPASAFTLLGPFATWQAATIGYNLNIGQVDMGGPMNLDEGYRVNLPNLTYGFDATFLNYFGSNGVVAVEAAMTILNGLPAASSMTPSLTEFPLQSKGPRNFTAANLGILDLKSYVLGSLLAQLGLGNPERWTWTLRDRVVNGTVTPNITNYLVIRRNFDPISGNPTNVVNGTLFTYRIRVNPRAPLANYDDAVEQRVDPLATEFTTVAGVDNADPSRLQVNLLAGEYFTGLTRDDAGGLRHLLRFTAYKVNSLIGTFTVTNVNASPFGPPGSTNLATNQPVITALRPGVEKVGFTRVSYDSLLGTTLNFTNVFTDTYITNSRATNQTLFRVLTTPDIIFTAEDLGLSAPPSALPILFARSSAAAWANNSALNTVSGAAASGPGTIPVPIIIRFSKLGPHILNQTQFFLDEGTGTRGFVWGFFDTASITAVFPQGSSVRALEQQVLGR